MDILGGNPVGTATGSGGGNNQNQGLSGLNQASLLNALAPGLFSPTATPTNNPVQGGQNLLNSAFNELSLFSPQTYTANTLNRAPQAVQPFGPMTIPNIQGQAPAPAAAPAPAPAPAPAAPPLATVVGQYSQAPAGWINEGPATGGNSWGAYKYGVPAGTPLPPGFAPWNG